MPSLDTPIALHEVDKLARRMSGAQGIPAWLNAWASDVLAGRRRRTHLAVMTGPYLELLLDGTKTIESRFTRHRVAPFEQVADGDVIFFKPSAGPITAAGLAGTVRHLNLGIVPLDQVADRYGAAIAPADGAFWADRAAARYATLVTMLSVVKAGPVPIHKRDRRGWVVLNSQSAAAQRLF